MFYMYIVAIILGTTVVYTHQQSSQDTNVTLTNADGTTAATCPHSLQCTHTCVDGFTKDSYGCDTCQCDDTCKNYTCANNYTCDMTFMNCTSQPCSSEPKCISDVCILPKVHGPCRARKPRYFYNTETDDCELFYYGGCGGNENNFRTKDICTVKCKAFVKLGKPTCSSVMCRMHCEHGFTADDNGCEICACQQPPKPTCPPMICSMHCEHGFLKDNNSCEICTCQDPPRPTCSTQTCNNSCPHGYQFEDNGCETCICTWHFCSNISCNLDCVMSGYMADKDCIQCRCNELTEVPSPDLQDIPSHSHNHVTLTSDLSHTDRIIVIVAALLLIALAVVMVTVYICHKTKKTQKEASPSDQAISFTNPVYGQTSDVYSDDESKVKTMSYVKLDIES